VTLDLDAWVELRQSGRLLDRAALASLPDPGEPPSGIADRLRDALTGVGSSVAAHGEALSTLLEVVLEDACGLTLGWRKGLGADDAQTLLDGTVLKPRWLFTRGGEVVFAAFVTAADRIGLHKGRRDFARVVEYLRRRKLPLGLLTNGRDWRVVFADPDSSAWVEWVGERWLEGDALTAAFALLRRVLSNASLSPGEGGAPSPLIAAIRRTRRGQAKLSAELGERVRAAVELLLKARHAVLEPSWDDARRKDVYAAACHFVMRLVVVLFAEARELLPVDTAVYHGAYGLRGLMESLERAGREQRLARKSAWPRLLALFRLLHTGSPHPMLVVPEYGGELFRPRRAGVEGERPSMFPPTPLDHTLGLLEDPADPPVDDVVYRMLVLLTRTTEKIREGTGVRTVAAPVVFTELTSEYIGILYEGLLDYELHKAGDAPIVFLALGDQPALPLDRLEAMTDKQLVALVEKAKVKRAAVSEEDGEEGEDEGEVEAAEGGDLEGDETASEEEAPLGEEEAPVEDERAVAMRRALAWAEKAAIAAKLVKAPRGKKGKDDPARKAELESAAKQLIADVKLRGELYLVRWGGTRKGAGTFYTRPQLTLPTVRRTLEPLLAGEDGKMRAPEDLLALKVCDPAMGSGSFLVATLRVLTEAVVRSLHEHGRVEKKGDLVHIGCEVLPEDDRDQAEDRVEAIVRRAVVEHCVYGVDLDPLAVELARVSLWVETLDRRLPFTFLDHKLRCGDALVGTWLDRFRDYPLLAWWRQSPDEKWRGVTHEGDVWADALKETRKQVVEEQRKLLAGEVRLPFDGISEDDLKTAIERVQALYRELRRVPASRPDKRAEIWRKKIAIDPALRQVREVFDMWCALWFWPLERLADAPRPLEFFTPSEVARDIVRELRDERRFFHPTLFTPRLERCAQVCPQVCS
jgi:hypothetical protein